MPSSSTSSRGSGVSSINNGGQTSPSPQPSTGRSRTPLAPTTATAANTNGASTSSGNGANSTGTRKRQRTLVSCTECHRRKQKCDRKWPCGNCTSRSASHLCQFERKVTKKDANGKTVAKSTTAVAGSSGKDQTGNNSDDSAENGEMDSDGMAEMESPANAREFGYSITGANNTSLNVLEKLDIGGSDTLRPVYSDRTFRFANPGDLAAYNAFIRLIPARPYTHLLTRVFFTEANFIYGLLHEGTFMRMLEEWWAVATADPNARRETDPYITHDIHFFPALLLQVLACALQLLPIEHHTYLSQMKLGVRETFGDLSNRLTSGACELAALLGGTGTLSIARVQQAFLRASWLKNEGRMHEAWHSLGTAIRSAQEQGMHVEGRQRGGQSNRELWYREIERRVWINLYCWDRFQSMLLGRPTMINDKHCTAIEPLDAAIPEDLSEYPPMKKGVMDPPTMFTARIIEHKLCHLVNELDDLNQSFTSSNPDFVRLDALHAKIMAFAESFPPEFAIANRNSTFDDICPRLQVQATLVKCTFFSIVVALHRPYLFLREKSRREIVKASLTMLGCQDHVLRILPEHLHRIYAICFYTFDPSVLISAVVITNCGSLDETTLMEAVTAVREGWKRLRTLGMNVKLAEKGSVVLKVLLRKVETVIEKWKAEKDTLGSTGSTTTGSERTRVGRKSPTRSPNVNSNGKTGPLRSNSTKARRVKQISSTAVANTHHHHHPYSRPSPPDSVTSLNSTTVCTRDSASPMINTHPSYAVSKAMGVGCTMIPTPSTNASSNPTPPEFIDTLDAVLTNSVISNTTPLTNHDLNNQHIHHHHHHHEQFQSYNHIPVDPSLHGVTWTTTAMNHLHSTSNGPTATYDFNTGNSPSSTASDGSGFPHLQGLPQGFFEESGFGDGVGEGGIEPWSSTFESVGMTGGATIMAPTDGMWQGLLGIFDV